MQDIIMQLEQRHIDALEKAEAMMVDSGFRQYLELKSLFADGSPSARVRFRPLFTNYYRLNVGGLTDEFKDRYFEILFGDDVIVNGQPNFSSILKELFEIRTRKNLKTMQFSFRPDKELLPEDVIVAREYIAKYCYLD